MASNGALGGEENGVEKEKLGKERPDALAGGTAPFRNPPVTTLGTIPPPAGTPVPIASAGGVDEATERVGGAKNGVAGSKMDDYGVKEAESEPPAGVVLELGEVGTGAGRKSPETASEAESPRVSLRLCRRTDRDVSVVSARDSRAGEMPPRMEEDDGDSVVSERKRTPLHAHDGDDLVRLHRGVEERRRALEHRQRAFEERQSALEAAKAYKREVLTKGASVKEVEEARTDVEEAKKAAEEAKKAVEEAKKAVEEATKAAEEAKGTEHAECGGGADTCDADVSREHLREYAEKTRMRKKAILEYVAQLRVNEVSVDGLGRVRPLPVAGESRITKLATFIPDVCALPATIPSSRKERWSATGQDPAAAAGGGDVCDGSLAGDDGMSRSQLADLRRVIISNGSEQEKGAVFMMQVTGGCKTRLTAELGMNSEFTDVFVVLGVVKNGGVSPLTRALCERISEETSAAEALRLCEYAVRAVAEVALLAAESTLPDGECDDLSPAQIAEGQKDAVLALLPVREDSVGKALAAEIFMDHVTQGTAYPLTTGALNERLQRWVTGDKGRIVVAMDEVAYLRNIDEVAAAKHVDIFRNMLKACSQGGLNAIPLFIGNFLDLDRHIPSDKESPIRGPLCPFFPVALVKEEHMLQALQTHVNPTLDLDGDGPLKDALHRLQGRPYFFFDCCLRECQPGMGHGDILERCETAATTARRALARILRFAWESKDAHLRLVLSDALVAVLLTGSNPRVNAAYVRDGERATGLGLFAARKHDGNGLTLLVHDEPLLCETLVEWFLSGDVSDVELAPVFQQIMSASATAIDLSASEVGTRMEPLLTLKLACNVIQNERSCSVRTVVASMLPTGYELPTIVADLPLRCSVGKFTSALHKPDLDPTAIFFGIANAAGPDLATIIVVPGHRIPVYVQCKVRKAASLREALPSVHERGIYKSKASRNVLANEWYDEHSQSVRPGSDTPPLTIGVRDLEFVIVIFSACGYKAQALDFIRWWNTHPAHSRHPIVPLQSTEEAFGAAHSSITDKKGPMGTLGKPKTPTA